MVTITAAQRNDPSIADWVRAKDKENAAEATRNAQLSATQLALNQAAEASRIASVEAWKQQNWYNDGTTATTTTAAQNIAAVAAQTVQKVVEAVKSVVGGGVITPPIKATGASIPTIQTTVQANSVTPVMTGAVSASTAAIVSDADKRRAEAGAFTGWDNDAAIRAKQQKSWDIYIQTGSWNSAEQQQLYIDAEAMRKAINPTYGGAPYGTPNKAAADALILPDTQPNLGAVGDSFFGGLKGLITGAAGTTSSDVGGMMKIGLFGLGAFVVLSMFKGK